MRSVRRIATLSVLGLAAACFTLSPQADPSRFYHLRSLSPVATRTAGPSVGVGVVDMPLYLDRSQVIQRIGAAEVQPLPNDYWAVPLPEQIQHVLAEELRALTGLDRVPRYPWPRSDRPERRVDVDIIRFEPDSLGTVELHARWEIRSTEDTPATLAVGEDTWREEAAGDDMTDRVDAMSRALSALARDIAARLR